MDWRTRAACRDSDPELFFSEHPAEARKVCARCEVQAQCLDLALSFDYQDGVFGGTTARQRGRTFGDATARYRRQKRYKQRRGEVGPPEGMPHGDRVYKDFNCRCEVCMAGHAAYTRRWRQKAKEAT